MPEVPSPDWLSWAFWAKDPASIRDLVITIAALIGIPFVIWREWLHHRQTKAALHQAEIARQQAATAQLRHEAQVEADRERRITDNFTRAVEQLGSDKLATRLGAIYALERLARESKDDHWPIMETLTAYVRERAPWPPIRATEPIEKGEEEEPRPETDVQAVLTVIGRRCLEHEDYEDRDQFLDLSGTDLRGTTGYKAHLEKVSFIWAHLEGASLVGAHLERAVFYDAHLEGADLTRTDLTQEQFDSAFTDEATIVPPHIKRPGKPARITKVTAALTKVTATPTKDNHHAD
jgi:Pentapeptide repeats (8 copies)